MKEEIDIRARALKELDDATQCGDTEFAHIAADNVLCVLLEELGFSDVVEKYDQIYKWHA